MAENQQQRKLLKLPGVRVLPRDWNNFSGIPDREYNREGARSFVIGLDEETAMRLFEEGYNVKFPEEGSDYQPTLKVTISRDNGPLHPNLRIFLLDSPEGIPQRITDAKILSSFDDYSFEYADLSINPYHWTRRGKDGDERSGISAYLHVGYFILSQMADPFADKYNRSALQDEGLPFD